MTTLRSRIAALFVIAASVMPVLSSCGGGIPVRLRIDEFTMEIALDDLVQQAFQALKSQGLFPPETRDLPELWPASLPAVKYRALLASEPIPVDLTPEPDSPDFEKYEPINKAEQAINRIELNRLILRIDVNTLSISLPELRLQVADAPDADPTDRLSWETIGVIPSAPPGFVGDLELEFIAGREILLNAQFMDEEKELALRVVGNVELDTEVSPRLPSGSAQIRMIVVTTFFVDPEGAAGVAGDLAGEAGE
jgi:hypothetical protein